MDKAFIVNDFDESGKYHLLEELGDDGSDRDCANVPYRGELRVFLGEREDLGRVQIAGDSLIS